MKWSDLGMLKNRCLDRFQCMCPQRFQSLQQFRTNSVHAPGKPTLTASSVYAFSKAQLIMHWFQYEVGMLNNPCCISMHVCNMLRGVMCCSALSACILHDPFVHTFCLLGLRCPPCSPPISLCFALKRLAEALAKTNAEIIT